MRDHSLQVARADNLAGVVHVRGEAAQSRLAVAAERDVDDAAGRRHENACRAPPPGAMSLSPTTWPWSFTAAARRSRPRAIRRQ